jgi:hypothetical protein
VTYEHDWVNRSLPVTARNEALTRRAALSQVAKNAMPI